MSFNNPYYGQIPERSILPADIADPETGCVLVSVFWMSPDHKTFLNLHHEFTARDLEVLKIDDKRVYRPFITGKPPNS